MSAVVVPPGVAGIAAAGLIAVALALAVAPALARSAARRPPRGARPRPSGGGPRWSPTVERWRRRRLRRSIVAPSAIGDWLDAVARSVRRGDSASRALAIVPDDPALELRSAPLRLALERGSTVSEAAESWHRSAELDAHAARSTPLVAQCAAVIGCAAEVGGSLAEPIDRLAAAMRQRDQLDRERRVQGAQARLSAIVLTVLPLAVLAVLLIADADVRSVVVSPFGFAIVGAGVSLDALGAWWMHRIVTSVR